MSPALPDVAAAGRTAVAVAMAEWLRDVRDLPSDPHQCALITRYLRAVGDKRDYPAKGPDGHPFKWCGAFWGFCWRGPAVGLHQEILDSLIESTYRLMIYAGHNDPGLWPYTRVRYDGTTYTMAKWLAKHPRWSRKYAHGMQAADAKSILPGDLLTVGHGRWGQGGHIVLAAGVHGGRILTWEGNTTGPGPHGDSREGVAWRLRKYGEVRLHIRPGEGDLLPGVEYIR